MTQIVAFLATAINQILSITIPLEENGTGVTYGALLLGIAAILLGSKIAKNLFSFGTSQISKSTKGEQ